MLQKFFIKLLLLLLSFIEIITTDCNTTSLESIKRNDCFAHSTPTTYCCYKAEGDGKGKCEEIYKNELSTKKEYDCGITNENYGKYEFGQYHPKQIFDIEGFQGCGVYDPKDKNDCLEYSELSNSCCFFQNSEGKKACFSIGKKFDGESTSFNYDGYKVECNSFNLILSIYLLLLLFFIF